MTDNELERYKTLLEEMRAELESELRRRDEIAIEKEPDELDEVQLAGSRDLAISELDRKAALLRKVKAAIERIKDSNYGFCENCGEEIRPKRLAAVPWTSLCLRCQEAADELGDSSDSDRGAQFLSDAA